jgi:hypothetical protein
MLNCHQFWNNLVKHKIIIMKKIFLFLSALIFSVSSPAQNAAVAGAKIKPQQVETEYDRNSLDYLMLDYGDNGFNDLLKKSFLSIKVNDKFDDNTTERRFLKPPVTREEILKSLFFNPTTGNNITDRIGKLLVTGRYSNDIIAKWFSRRSDGSFGVELLQQRGLYNATDADVKAANSSKLGLAKIMDSGEQLLNKSYIIVFDVSDLISKEEYYNRLDKNSKTPAKRDKNGFQGNVNAYIYKLNFNDSINAVFWQQLWADQGDPKLKEKKQAFDNFSFPVKYITRLTTSAEASQYNPGEPAAPKIQATRDQLMTEFVNSGINNALMVLDRNIEDFRVKTVLYGTRPLRAKIGMKENLRIDQRYFVYEMRQKNDGDIKANRRGVIRATHKIIDNRQVATGQSETSVFYQVAGKRLDAGMLLQQRSDLGLALGLGYSSGGVGGYTGRLEINISSFFKKDAPSMIKLYIEGGYEVKETSIIINTVSQKYKDFTRYELGLGKEFCPLRNLRLQPFIGIGLEQITHKDDSKLNFSSLYEHAGIMAGINIFHNVQITGAFSYFLMGGKITDENKKEWIIFNEAAWGNAFNRKGTALDLGFRIEF